MGWFSIKENILIECNMSDKEDSIPEGVVTISKDAFMMCVNMESITFPSTLKSIQESAFRLSGLKYVYIPANVIEIGNGAFSDCLHLKTIDVSKENPIYKSVKGNLYSKSGKIILQYAAGKTEDHFIIPKTVANIGARSFSGSSFLKTVEFPPDIVGIGAWAFSGCDKLDIETLPSTINVIHENAFRACDNITSIKLPKGLVILDDQAFFGCKNLISVFVPESVTTIGWMAFGFCPKLKHIILPRKFKKSIKKIVDESDNIEVTYY